MRKLDDKQWELFSELVAGLRDLSEDNRVAGIKELSARPSVDQDVLALVQLHFMLPSEQEKDLAAETRVTETPVPLLPSVGDRRPQQKKPFIPSQQAFDGFRPLQWIGGGGYGQVWRAVAPGDGDRAVAMKFIQLDGNAGVVELRALDAMKNVKHPNLLEIIAYWQQDRLLVIAMQLGDKTLLDRLKEATKQGLVGIPSAELLEYLYDAARGLDELNSVGIQHRDVKPANLILFGRGVKVADFGLAKVLQGTKAKSSGVMTPAYAAPEFFKGQVTSWSDQYSLAVSYCQLRGGRLPFEVTTIEQFATAHLMDRPDLTMLPEAERHAVEKAMAKNPKDRWPSCKAFVTAIQNAMVDRPSATPMPLSEIGVHSIGEQPRLPEPGANSKAICPPVAANSLPEAKNPHSAIANSQAASAFPAWVNIPVEGQRWVKRLIRLIHEGRMSSLRTAIDTVPHRLLGLNIIRALHEFAIHTYELKLALGFEDRETILHTLPTSIDCLDTPPGLFHAYADELRPALIAFLRLLSSVSTSSDRQSDIIDVVMRFGRLRSDTDLIKLLNANEYQR